MKSPNTFRSELLKELKGLKTVDCHSHTYLSSRYYDEGPYDLFSLTSYFDRDINSTAGGPIYEGAQTDEERWQCLKKILAKARNTTYWRFCLVAYRELFDLQDDELNDSNWRQVNESIRNRSSDPGWYRHVTEDICGLETQIRNIPWFESWEPQYFTATLRLEPAIPLLRADLDEEAENRKGLEEQVNADIHDLKSAKVAVRALVHKYVDQGNIGIKLAHAYNRTLHSVPAAESEVSGTYDRILKKQDVDGDALKALQDHMIFFSAELAREMDLIFQIHTGVQNNWGIVPESDPLLLIPLLQEFTDVRFDLFHAGYPYSRMLGMLGKHWPNVWLNMAWMYVISIAASRQLLSEWIDLVPGYRILGFGSDVHYPEMILGHLELARSCVADVLAGKVERDYLSEEEAVSLARRMFRDNGIEFYRLTKGISPKAK